ncbi:hypothetical protein M434DRAFT_377575 [Hypoxylon sp. CO27-5]|nr:hypothetical protein M434DRAFT_377575 [Hypoxylon sp. CO27-5]
MADPVGITGTAIGIASLCLRIYSGLNDYLNDFRGRDIYVAKVLHYLGRLQDLARIVESAIPAFQNEHYAPSHTVVLCLQDCEDELKDLDAEIRKYNPKSTNDMKGRLREAKKRLQFPFARHELEKFAGHLDRVNSLLSVALQGLGLHIQSAYQNKLTDLYNSTRQTVSELTTIHNKVHEIHSSVPQLSLIQVNESPSVILLRELIASQQLHHQNAANLEERMRESQDILVQSYQSSPGERFFQMLMSKPDFLRKWQDDLATIQLYQPENITGINHNLLQNGRKQVVSSCGCQVRYETTRKFSKWFFFTRFDESIIKFRHEPGCPKYQTYQTDRRHTVSIVYTGLSQLLKIAIEASLMWSTGAGGASFSPTFRYYAMVDKTQSPAFRVVDFIAKGIASFLVNNQGGTILELEMGCNQISRVGILKLQRIFASKSSLPTDIDQDGYTLLEEFFSALWPIFACRLGLVWISRAVLLSLLELKIPSMRNSLERHYESIVNHRVERIDVESEESNTTVSIQEIVPLLTQRQFENPIRITDWNFLLYARCRAMFFGIEGLGEALSLDNSLFVSLLRRDETMLERVLPTVSTPSDWVSNGISAAHIAVFWPQGLRLLVGSHPEASTTSIDGIITPLEFAMFTSRQICQENGDKMCKNCPCSESAKILLDAIRGCHLTEENCCLNNEAICTSYSPCISEVTRVQKGATSWLDVDRLDASYKAVYTLLSHIKYWREKLMQLAESHLRVDEKRQIDLSNSLVLDSLAPNVIQNLEAKGISPFSELQLNPNDYRLSPPSNTTGSKSIYHQIRDTYVANIAFDLGFRDIDASYNGRSPIMSQHLSLDYSEWLLIHGANSMNLVPWGDVSLSEKHSSSKLPQWTVAHHLMAKAGAHCSMYGNDDIPIITSLINRFSGFQIGDNCECGCCDLEEGCSPLAVFLSAYSVEHDRQKKECKRIPALSTRICEHVSLLEMDGACSPTTTNAVIRALTFEELELRHTCCAKISPGGDLKTYSEDFCHIRDEDESLLEELEELVAEFKGEYQSQGHTLSSFLEGYWTERMEKIKWEKEANRLSRSQLEATADLGVKFSEATEESETMGESNGDEIKGGYYETLLNQSSAIPSSTYTMRDAGMQASRDEDFETWK